MTSATDSCQSFKLVIRGGGGSCPAKSAVTKPKWKFENCLIVKDKWLKIRPFPHITLALKFCPLHFHAQKTPLPPVNFDRSLDVKDDHFLR